MKTAAQPMMPAAAPVQQQGQPVQNAVAPPAAEAMPAEAAPAAEPAPPMTPHEEFDRAWEEDDGKDRVPESEGGMSAEEAVEAEAAGEPADPNLPVSADAGEPATEFDKAWEAAP